MSDSECDAGSVITENKRAARGGTFRENRDFWGILELLGNMCYT
jgi:hypothetical protein